MDTSDFTVLLLLVGVALRVGLLALAIWFIVPRRRACPHCGEETLGLVTPPLLRRLRIERRWCVCGWEGISKKIRTPRLSGPRVAAKTPLLTMLVIIGASGVACAPAGDPVDDLFRDGARWVDLTYGFGDETIYWPTADPFRFEVVTEGMTDGGYYYSAYNFAGAEHGGTHLDAPVHFAEGRQTADEIPLSNLIGPAVVVDVAARAANDPDYLVAVSDFEEFEATHGEIQPRSIVLLRTGWGARWPDRQAYLGTDMTGPEAVAGLHFPGLGPEGARWLVSRNIKAIGIDTPSIDRGQSTTFESHQILYMQNIPGFENVANLDAMPLVGSYVVALPMKIVGGVGDPFGLLGWFRPEMSDEQSSDKISIV